MKEKEIDDISDILQGRKPSLVCDCGITKEADYVTCPGISHTEKLAIPYICTSNEAGMARYVCRLCGNTVRIMYSEGEFHENDTGMDILMAEIAKDIK